MSMHVVLLCAAGATWEPAALSLFERDPGTVVLRRCVDVDDLVAAATSGQAQVAVVAANLEGLDAPATQMLARHGVGVVAVAPTYAVEGARASARGLGIGAVLAEEELDQLGAAVRHVATTPAESETAAPTRGRVVAIWGPAGAPGRSSVALALASELAHRGSETLLIDADPAGGSLAQHLGVLDEISGLLAAGRLAGTADLSSRLPTVQRRIDTQLNLLSGLPRPDRWVEVRGSALEDVMLAACATAHVVVDTGASLEDDPGSDFGSRPGRNELTLAAVQAADDVVLVANPDPIGITRLVRGAAELAALTNRPASTVVLNKSRSSLAWNEKQVGEFLANAGIKPRTLIALPEDRALWDKAINTGRLPHQVGSNSGFLSGISDLADAVYGTASGQPTKKRRGRKGSRSSKGAQVGPVALPNTMPNTTSGPPTEGTGGTVRRP